MKLYYKPGACSLAVHIALNEIGADFELEQVDTTAQKTESGADYSAINPNGYVPALTINDGEVLTEAPAVLQYVADTRPEAGLAPVAGTIERTRLHKMLNFVASELHKAFGPFFAPSPLSEPERSAAEAGVARRMAFIDSTLGEHGPYLLGETYTVADSYAFVVANWANFVGIGLDRWPNVAAYVERIGRRPAVVKALQAEGLASA